MESTRIFAFILLFGAIVGFGGLALFVLAVPAIAAIMISLANITSIYMLARMGTTFRTVYFRIILICLALYVVGILLRFYHLRFGIELQVLSLAGIAGAYLLSSLKKPNLQLPDLLKLGWTLGYSICAIFILYNLLSPTILYFIDGLLFLAASIIGWRMYQESKLEG